MVKCENEKYEKKAILLYALTARRTSDGSPPIEILEHITSESNPRMIEAFSNNFIFGFKYYKFSFASI